MIVFTLLGASQLTSNFSLEFFVIDGEPVTKFMQSSTIHFEDGFPFSVNNKLDTLDVTSEEV